MTAGLCYSAMCLWEAFCEYAFTGTTHDAEPIKASIDAEREYYGTKECRDKVLRAVPHLEEAWDRVKDIYGDPFDWEFCPWFLTTCMDWSGDGIVMREDWADRLAEYEAFLREEFNGTRGVRDYWPVYVVSVAFTFGQPDQLGTVSVRAPSQEQAEYVALSMEEVDTVFSSRREGTQN